MTTEKLNEILKQHTLWLINAPNGERANLRYANMGDADLRDANLSASDLRDTYLRNADLRDANLRFADLRNADLRDANLRFADLCDADLRNAYLRNADLRNADLRNADLLDADLSGANLSGANLSGAKGLTSAINFLEAYFERTSIGYIAYKTFGGQYAPPIKWEIEPNSIIEENVNFDRTNNCGSGINVAPLQWVRKNYKGDIWKVLIRWEWLCGVCVPYNSDGKIRCERVELVEIVERN